MSNLRRDLFERPDVPDDEIDDIIDLAGRMQFEAEDAARAEGGRLTTADLEEIAAELNIDPRYVEEAIVKRRQLKKEEEAAQKAAKKKKKRLMLVGGGVLAALAVVLLIVAFGGKGSVKEAATAAQAAEQRLVAALERHAAVGPQLVALAGGVGADLGAIAAEIRASETVTARLAASDRLGAAVATRLSRLGPARGAEADARLNLQHEITGTQNRIATELRRYRAAVAAHQAAADTFSGGLAVSLGMAPAAEYE